MSTNLVRLAQIVAVLSHLSFAQSLLSQERNPSEPKLSTTNGWVKKFAHQKRQLAAKPVDLLFVGDSLTEFWNSTGKAIWDLEFHELHAVNFGIAGDRTENILFRLMRSDLASNPPRVIVVLAGTNNLSQEPPDTPEATTKAIESILEYLTRTCPTSRIYVLTLPPNGYDPSSSLRKRIDEMNRHLKSISLPDQVSLIDIYPVFVDEAHHWKPGATLDGTHFSQRGYDTLAQTIRPAIVAAKEPSR